MCVINLTIYLTTNPYYQCYSDCTNKTITPVIGIIIIITEPIGEFSKNNKYEYIIVNITNVKHNNSLLIIVVIFIVQMIWLIIWLIIKSTK